MELQNFLKDKNLTYREFSVIMNVDKTGSLVSKWINGKTTPKTIHLQKIYEVTEGKVTPDSFILSNKNKGKSLTKGKQDLVRLQEVYKKHQRQIPLKILATVMKGEGERDYSLSGVSRKINGSLPMKDFEMQRLKDFYKNTFNEDF